MVPTTTTAPKTELQLEQEWIEKDIAIAEEFARRAFSSYEGQSAALMLQVSAQSGLRVITAKQQLDNASDRAKLRKELEAALTELESIMHDETGSIEQIKDPVKRAKAMQLVAKINFVANQLGYCPAVGQVNPANFEPPAEQKFGLVGNPAAVAPAYKTPESEAQAQSRARGLVLEQIKLSKSLTSSGYVFTPPKFSLGSGFERSDINLIATGKTSANVVMTVDDFRKFFEKIDVYRARIETSGTSAERQALARFDQIYNAAYSMMLADASPAYCRSVSNGLSLTANLSTIQGALQRVRGDVTVDGEKINQHSGSVTTEYKKSSDNLTLAQDTLKSLGKNSSAILHNV